MESKNEMTIETQDEREWELRDEELDRYGPGRACPITAMPPPCCCCCGR